MDIPDAVQALIEQMGQRLILALTEDPESRQLAQRIQAHGFDVSVLLEATIALHRLEPGEEAPRENHPEPPPPAWSPEDEAFLRRFKIKLD